MQAFNMQSFIMGMPVVFSYRFSVKQKTKSDTILHIQIAFDQSLLIRI